MAIPPTAVTGDPSPRSTSSAAPSPRTGRRSASASSRTRPGRKLVAFDRAYERRWVAGADEAGRGCLAGPLVAAAVLFDYSRLGRREVRVLGRLNDSKQQTAEGRDDLYPLILRTAARVAIVSRSARTIDERGLHKSNLFLLRSALRRVAGPDTLCLSDGFRLGDLDGRDHEAVVGGDARSAAIAAASVLAKVTRDRYMQRADVLHPGWGFALHVGYSTPDHRAAIERQGISPLHRRSFRSVAYQQLGLVEEDDAALASSSSIPAVPGRPLGAGEVLAA